jgi:hypothetical protein
MHKFRIFLSYSHEDRQLAEKVVKELRRIGLNPVYDKDIQPGSPFTDAIKGLITHCHVFLPLITRNSQKRPWVHQETGYAMALDIPVLPIAIGNLPGQMISQLQAISVKPDLSDLPQRLKEANIEKVVFPPPQRPKSIVKVADWPDKRAELMAQYANRVVQMGAYGCLRQCGALSSFNIPDKDPADPVWDDREGDEKRSIYYRSLQREERRALEIHARHQGCFLIIDPTIDFSEKGPNVTKARLSTLLRFLEDMPENKVQIVFSSRAREGSLTIVGDWFVAESMVPRPEGYRQTVFTWHAPTVLRWVQKFDQEFKELCEMSTLKPKASCKAAIEGIEKIIRGLSPRREDRKP